jgi:NitT/TauT family transport system substrate-binding protein
MSAQASPHRHPRERGDPGVAVTDTARVTPGSPLSRRRRWYLLFAHLIAAVSFAAGGAAAQVPIRFTTDWAWQGSQAIWPMAERRGCFAREQLAVTIDRGYGAADALAKVATGTYDIGFADFNTLVQFNAKNPDKKVIGVFMVYDGSPTAITVLKASGITRPTDLAGKTLASPSGDASRLLFPLFARANRLDPAKVAWTTVSPELRETLLARGQADGIAGHMWTALIGLQALGVPADATTVMLYARWGLDLPGSALVAGTGWAAAHAQAVTGFIRCVVDGVNGALADPKGAMAALKTRDPLINEAIEAERLRLSLAVAVTTDNVKQHGMNAIARDRLERSAALVAEVFALPAPVLDDLWTDKYLPERAQLQIRQ